MTYLYCLPDRYLPITKEQESKLTHLINNRKLPASFKLNEEEVTSKDVIGYTDTLPQTQLGIRSIDDLRTWVKKQEWYGKS